MEEKKQRYTSNTGVVFQLWKRCPTEKTKYGSANYRNWGTLANARGPWKYIVKQQDLVTDRICHIVGNAATTLFWLDSWGYKIYYGFMIPRILYKPPRYTEVTVKDVGNSTQSFWDLRFRRNLKDNEALELVDLSFDLHLIVHTQTEDTWRWSLTPNGIFSIRSPSTAQTYWRHHWQEADRKTNTQKRSKSSYGKFLLFWIRNINIYDYIHTKKGHSQLVRDGDERAPSPTRNYLHVDFHVLFPITNLSGIPKATRPKEPLASNLLQQRLATKGVQEDMVHKLLTTSTERAYRPT